MFSLQTRCVLLNGPCRILLGDLALRAQLTLGTPQSPRGGEVTPTCLVQVWMDVPPLRFLNTVTGVKELRL